MSPESAVRRYEEPEHAFTDGEMAEFVDDFRHRFKKAMIQAAARNRDNAHSHRPKPFKVGCTMMTIDGGNLPGDYSVYSAYNFTPDATKRRGWEKTCAESNAMWAALEHGASLIVAIVTVSKELSTGDDSKAHDALHPCRDCRDKIRQLLGMGILRKDSIVLNVNDSDNSEDELMVHKWAEEERTVEQLLELYKDDEVA